MAIRLRPRVSVRSFITCQLDVRLFHLPSSSLVSIPLDNGVTSEVTVTRHAALHQFHYANGTDQLLLLLDITTDLAHSYEGMGTVAITTSGNNTRITGSGEFLPSFGQGSFVVYFCLDTRAFEQAKFYHSNSTAQIAYTNVTGDFNSVIGSQNPAGVLMGFSPGDDGVLKIRMGVSWTSSAKACSFAEDEIPDLDAFDQIKAAARFAFFATMPLTISQICNLTLTEQPGMTFSEPLISTQLVSAMILNRTFGLRCTALIFHQQTSQVTILSGNQLSLTGTAFTVFGKYFLIYSPLRFPTHVLCPGTLSVTSILSGP